MNIKLNDPYKNYIIISGDISYKEKDDVKNRLNISKLQDELLLRDFYVIPMGNNSFINTFLAHKEDCNNNDLRYDAIELMDRYKQKHVIIKYTGESDAKKILFDGREELLGIVRYEGNENNHNFFVEGNAFSFEPMKRYVKPKGIDDFKQGMIIEIKNNDNQWVEKKVIDPEVEYNRLYKLLIRYDKVRYEFDDSHLK